MERNKNMEEVHPPPYSYSQNRISENGNPIFFLEKVTDVAGGEAGTERNEILDVNVLSFDLHYRNETTHRSKPFRLTYDYVDTKLLLLTL